MGRSNYSDINEVEMNNPATADKHEMQHTILIVDDEEPVRTLLSDALAGENCKVIQAATGKQAYEILRNQPVDLLITDIVMPEQDGIALIMQLNSVAPKMPIIAISGGGGVQSGFDYLPVSKLVGANAILRKPFKLDELRNLVDSFVNQLPGENRI
jgi:DNA-binding NtrC family response regulator